MIRLEKKITQYSIMQQSRVYDRERTRKSGTILKRER